VRKLQLITWREVAGQWPPVLCANWNPCAWSTLSTQLKDGKGVNRPPTHFPHSVHPLRMKSKTKSLFMFSLPGIEDS